MLTKWRLQPGLHIAFVHHEKDRTCVAVIVDDEGRDESPTSTWSRDKGMSIDALHFRFKLWHAQPNPYTM